MIDDPGGNTPAAVDYWSRLSLMAAGHSICKCVHGTVSAQCRCPALDKTVYIVPCPANCPQWNEPEVHPDACQGSAAPVTYNSAETGPRRRAVTAESKLKFAEWLEVLCEATRDTSQVDALLNGRWVAPPESGEETRPVTALRQLASFNGVTVLVFLVLSIVANVLGWVTSVVFISELSLVALILPPLAALKVEKRIDAASTETSTP